MVNTITITTPSPSPSLSPSEKERPPPHHHLPAPPSSPPPPTLSAPFSPPPLRCPSPPPVRSIQLLSRLSSHLCGVYVCVYGCFGRAVSGCDVCRVVHARSVQALFFRLRASQLSSSLRPAAFRLCRSNSVVAWRPQTPTWIGGLAASSMSSLRCTSSSSFRKASSRGRFS
jgi:hypothetical protein